MNLKNIIAALLFLLLGMTACENHLIIDTDTSAPVIASRSVKAITREEAWKLVQSQVLENNISKINVFVSRNEREANDTIKSYYTSIPTVDYPHWFFFIDDYPRENWSHSCRYIYVSMNGSIEIKYGKYPPVTESLDKLAYIQSDLFKPVEVFKNIVSSRTITDLSHKYALIINGGASKEDNHFRYWNNCSAFYTALTKIYGYDKSHIKVLISDGTNPTNDRNLGNNQYDSSPTDLDNDGIIDVTGDATYYSVTSALNSYAATLTEYDDLTIFITSHGGSTSNNSNYFFSLWEDHMFDYQFSNLIDKLKVRCLNVVLTTCNSGGFINALSKENRNIYTACRANEYSHGGAKNNYYDYFAYYWISGITGQQPDDNKKIYSDYNNDSNISFREALKYETISNTRSDEHAQSSSIPNSLEDRVSINKYIYGDFSINKLPHFSQVGDYNIAPSLLAGCSISNWEVTSYSASSIMDDQPLSIRKDICNGSVLSLNNPSESVYYEIKANISTPDGVLNATTNATSNAPSPYIGMLYWSTDNGQFSMTTNIEHGNALNVSEDFILNLEYVDKAGNRSNSNVIDPFYFMCVTSKNRYLEGKKSLSLNIEDCTNGLKIKVRDACGTSSNYFTIPCNIIYPYYSLISDSDIHEVTIRTINKEVKTNIPQTLPIVVDIYKSDGTKFFTQNYTVQTENIKIKTKEWPSGDYKVSISNGINMCKRKLIIK